MGVTETRSTWSRQIGVAVALAIVGLLLSITVLGRDIFGRTHLLGSFGEWLSIQLFVALGWAAYLFIVIWWVCVAFLFQRRPTWMNTRRLIGWLLLFPSAMVLASWLRPGIGGSLGAWLALWLDIRTGRFWAVV